VASDKVGLLQWRGRVRQYRECRENALNGTAPPDADRRQAGSLGPAIERRRHTCDDPEGSTRLFEDRFNAGDLDGLMAPYEPDVAVIPTGERRPR
jgi:hypothetical protein